MEEPRLLVVSEALRRWETPGICGIVIAGHGSTQGARKTEKTSEARQRRKVVDRQQRYRRLV